MSPSAGFVALVLAATSISLGVIAVKHGYEGGADPETVLAARLLVAAPLAALALLAVLALVEVPLKDAKPRAESKPRAVAMPTSAA